MTTKTILSDDDQLDYWRLSNGNVQAFGRAIQQAVMNSPEIQQALADQRRIDWLADPNNHIGNVQLPTKIVEQNAHSLRDAIDAAMEQQA